MWFRKSDDQKLRELVSGLIDRMEKLERDSHALQLDWENTYDKIKTMMGRVAKRHEAVLKLEADSHTAETADVVTNGQDGVGRLLTPRQMEIQQQVMRRRMGISGR